MECVAEMFEDGGLKTQTINQDFFFDSQEQKTIFSYHLYEINTIHQIFLFQS